jgi:hypothetical protein
MDALCFIYVACQADTRTGVWTGSAGALAGELAMSPRTARDVLEKMSNMGYIKRFTLPGKHACYPILVHKFLVTDGEHKGQQLNAIGSASPSNLQYFPREQEGELSGQHRVEHGASQKKIEKGESENKETIRKNLAANAPPPGGAQYRPVLACLWKDFEQKKGQPPSWSAKDFASLSNFLKNHKHSPEEIILRFKNYVASTEEFVVRQGCSLSFFFSRFDSFISGPILERRINSNAESRKPTLGDNMRASLEAFRAAEQERTS